MNYEKDRVTIYQVAKASGVSLATVSRVINKQGSVTPATRKKVEDTIARLGYRPSSLAQSLATNRTTNIGVVIPSANYVFISNVLAGITEVARERGYLLTLFATTHSREEALASIEKVISSHVDGVIVFDDQLSKDDVSVITSYNVPAVIIDEQVSGDIVANIHLSYDPLLTSFIKQYYSRRGNKAMSFLHVHNAGRLLQHAEKSFIRNHNELGKEYNIINCDDSYTRTYAQFLEYFKTNRSGLFVCYRDSIGAAVMNAATDSGLNVPNDVEILTLIGTKYARICRPVLSCFHIDMEEVGKRSMYMLIDLINNQLQERTATFDATYSIGESTVDRRGLDPDYK
ncbi:MAG: LacI family transcriptional regulator [Bacilli bacterium]|nr:LacI family transcriptional regulator [Bacilli bacterium]